MQILSVIKRHGYRLEDVATMLGITKGSLSATINGSPNVKKLIDIALKIGCSPAEFFDDWYENEGKEQKRDDGRCMMEEGRRKMEDAAPSPNDDLPFGGAPKQEPEQKQGADELPFDNGGKQMEVNNDAATAMVGLVRCPKCGHSIRLFGEGSE